MPRKASGGEPWLRAEARAQNPGVLILFPALSHTHCEMSLPRCASVSPPVRQALADHAYLGNPPLRRPTPGGARTGLQKGLHPAGASLRSWGQTKGGRDQWGPMHTVTPAPSCAPGCLPETSGALAALAVGKARLGGPCCKGGLLQPVGLQHRKGLGRPGVSRMGGPHHELTMQSQNRPSSRALVLRRAGTSYKDPNIHPSP